MAQATKELREAAQKIDLAASRANTEMRGVAVADAVQGEEVEAQPVFGRIQPTGCGSAEPLMTTAELIRAKIARMLRDAGLEPNRASIEAVAHPETSGLLYRLAYQTLAPDEIRYSERDADIIQSVEGFIAVFASSLQRDRNSLEGPLV